MYIRVIIFCCIYWAN